MAGARQFACKKEVNKKFRLTFVRLAFAWIVKKVGEKKTSDEHICSSPEAVISRTANTFTG
jgi:hypothetical protein